MTQGELSLPSSVEPWLFQVEPYPQESFSHFLGRFRRANHLRSAHLAAMLGARSHVVSYWESPSRQRRPSPPLLQQLAQLTGVSVNRLQAMWLSPATGLHWPTNSTAESISDCCYRSVLAVIMAFRYPAIGQPASAIAANFPSRRCGFTKLLPKQLETKGPI